MEQITVVIGDRLGKGQKVAAGAEKAGARAVVVPGVAADMKLGDMMKAENATFGISFCGSGGAGAITAQTKYGYKAKYGMRSVEEGVTAINEGCNVLGFGFMDKEELGERLVEAWKRNTAHKYERAIHHHGEGCRQRRKQITGLRRCPEPCAGCGDETSSHILLRIEPQDVTVVHAREAVRKRPSCSSFAP